LPAIIGQRCVLGSVAKFSYNEYTKSCIKMYQMHT